VRFQSNLLAGPPVDALEFTFSPGTVFASFYSALTRAASLLVNITDIEIRAPDTHLYNILHSFSFPQLTDITTVLPIRPSLATFLDRHPSIKILSLIPTINVLSLPRPLRELATPSLPNLQTFIGSSYDFSIIVRETKPLQQVVLHWLPKTPQLEVERIFTNMEKCSSSLNLLQFLYVRDWELGILDTVSRRLPNIVALHFTHGFVGALQHIDLVCNVYLALV
jgi:hypothetical protein